MITEDRLQKILDFYGFEGTLTEAKTFGNGHINDTILLRYDVDGSEKKYVLQKINKFVFKHPDELMANTVAVTTFLRKKIIAAGGDPERETVNVIPAANGDVFFVDEDGEYWRITAFIADATSYETVECPEDFYATGLAFGHFQSMLTDYPADTLYETIPGFHNTRARFKNFKRVLAEDKLDRVKNAQPEIQFLLEREALANWSMDSYDRGELPLRVTHNDTKLNNIMMDNATGKGLCVIDLDTVMPGFAMNDFGDAIRSGTNTAAEDEPDLDKVHCDLALYDIYAKGFIEGCEGKLTEHEIDTLPYGAIGLCYEQTLRFLTDYLEGDVYYKTEYPEHNLIRSRTQMKLVLEQEEHWDEIQTIIKKYK